MLNPANKAFCLIAVGLAQAAIQLFNIASCWLEVSKVYEMPENKGLENIISGYTLGFYLVANATMDTAILLSGTGELISSTAFKKWAQILTLTVINVVVSQFYSGPCQMIISGT